MLMPKIMLGALPVSRFIIGGNPFSGFSHQGSERDRLMRAYYTVTRIKQTLADAERLGINTLCARADQHISRLLMEYRNEGGAIQWIAQTCQEMKSILRSAEDAVKNGAAGCYIHGGVMDYLHANNLFDEVFTVIEFLKSEGIAAGIAGHNPKVFEWAEKNIEADFYMCSYYNASKRNENAELDGKAEFFRDEDSEEMTRLIQRLSRPAVHYKILAAGRNDLREAFEYAVNHMRPCDAVCVGVYTCGKSGMLEEDVRLFLDQIEKKADFGEQVM